MVANRTVSLSFSFNLNICNDNLKASNTLSYDVASVSNFPKSSLIAVRKEVVSFSNFGLIASIEVSNSRSSLVAHSLHLIKDAPPAAIFPLLNFSDAKMLLNF